MLLNSLLKNKGAINPLYYLFFDAFSIASDSSFNCFASLSTNHILRPTGRLYASINDQPP
jgi:hypothetical protein